MLFFIANNSEKIKEASLNQSRSVITGISQLPAPEIWRPINDFAKEKASDTISNAAFHAYKKYKGNAPILAIENFFPHSPMSRAEDLKDMIEQAREKFVEQAKEQGMNTKKAKEAAEKIIGATWDVGHISAMRQAGLTEEELVVFDILTKPKMKLTKKKEKQVKDLAQKLLIKLKEEKLVLDWKKRTRTRADIQITIEDTLWGLPEPPYTQEVKSEMSALVYQHVYDSYFGAGHSVYT